MLVKYVFIILCIEYLTFRTNAHLDQSKVSNSVDLELQKRREIAKKYLDNLAKETIAWVDPYDMIPNKDELLITTTFDPPINEGDSTDFKDSRDDDATDFKDSRKGDSSDIKYSKKDDSTVFKVKNNQYSETYSSDQQNLSKLDHIYISRWLKKLILKIETDAGTKSSALTIQLTSEVLDSLIALSNSKALKFADIDELVSNVIDQAIILKQEDFDWTDLTAYKSSFVVKCCVIFFIGLITYIFYNCAVNRPISTSICCFIVINVFWHWVHLYQKQKAIKHSKLSLDIPMECKSSEFSLYEGIYAYIKSYFVQNDCSKYYEALMVDPVWEVSFSVAMSEALSAMLVQPLYSISKALNASIKLLFDELSYFNTIILILFLFLLLVMIFSYKIKLPFFFAVLEPANVRHNYIENVPPPNILTETRETALQALSNVQMPNSNRPITSESVAPGELQVQLSSLEYSISAKNEECFKAKCSRCSCLTETSSNSETPKNECKGISVVNNCVIEDSENYNSCEEDFNFTQNSDDGNAQKTKMSPNCKDKKFTELLNQNVDKK